MIIAVSEQVPSTNFGGTYFIDMEALADGPYKVAILEALANQTRHNPPASVISDMDEMWCLGGSAAEAASVSPSIESPILVSAEVTVWVNDDDDGGRGRPVWVNDFCWDDDDD